VGKPPRRRTVTAALRVTAPPSRDNRGLAGYPGGPVVVVATAVAVNAAASVFTPSAGSRPSRLAAVAQTSECRSPDYADGGLDRIAFPLQVAVSGSTYVGSILINGALMVLTATATIVLHRLDL
jgi:hypothetical protein